MVDPIVSADEWISRSADAAEELIREYGYRQDDFHLVVPGDDPTLSWSLAYPIEWGRCVRQDEEGNVLSGWISGNHIPNGLTLYWPYGVDDCGEAYDPQCPVGLLDEVKFWSAFEPTEADLGIQ